MTSGSRPLVGDDADGGNAAHARASTSAELDGARDSGQPPNGARRPHVRGRPTYPARFGLDSANSRLRAALARLHRHPDAEVRAAGERIGAAAVVALEAALDEAELAHPLTRQRRQRLERSVRKAEQLLAARTARTHNAHTQT